MNRCACPSRRGWTLVELLVVIAILALLMGLMAPALLGARLAARVVLAHADLRSIDQALLMYQQDHRGDLPPTRFSCSSGLAFPLPVELGQADYLHVPLPEGEEQALLEDVFNPTPGQSYKYRAPGPAWENTTTYVPNGSWMWIPDDAPACGSTTGQWVNDRDDSAVQYAAWSVGPDDGSPPAVVINKHPLPQAAWYGNGQASGVITHYQSRQGLIHLSP